MEVSNTTTEAACAITPLAISKTNETLPVILTSTPKPHIDDNEAAADGQASQLTNHGHTMKIDPEVYPLLMGASTPPKEAMVTCSGICCLNDIILSPIPPQYYVVNSPPIMDVSSSSGRSTDTSSPVNPSPHILHEGPNSDKALDCKLCNQHLAAIDMP